MRVDEAPRAPRPVTVGLGDTVPVLLRRNPSLAGRVTVEAQPLRLSLEEPVELSYDDGDLKLGGICTIRTNIDGNDRFSGVAFVGAKLCFETTDDWDSAIDKAGEIITKFERENPDAIDLRSFHASASEQELQAVAGPTWRKSSHDIDRLLTVAEAKRKFAIEAESGHREILEGLHAGTLANLGFYAGKKAVFAIAVSKTGAYGGDKLDEQRKRAMRYEITLSFQLRYDVDPPPSASR